MKVEVLKLTAEIVTSHASRTELSTEALVKEIKEIYHLLASLGGGVAVPETTFSASRAPKPRPVKLVASPEAKAVADAEGPVFGDPQYMEFMASREG